MFKKRIPPSPQGRQRQPIDRGNAVVFSYHANRAIRPPTSQRGGIPNAGAAEAAAKERRRKRLIKRGPMILLAAILLAALFINILLTPTPHLVMNNTGSKTRVFLRQADVYQQAANDIFASNALYRSKLTVDISAISARLLAQFPELEQAVVSLPLVGNQPTIYLRPRDAALLLTAATGKPLIVDSTGRALMDASEASRLDDLMLPVVQDQSGLHMNPGAVVLPSRSVAFIAEMTGQLKAKRLSVTDMALPRAASQLNVRISGTPYVIKFNLRGNARAEVGAFLAAKQHLEREGKIPSYIDVRVDNKVYYK
ncbi:MAG TPA: hypothetical protein VJ836_05225 [Candidatus Saccharimonadales bacterium]|nr:hypothetical protein [Candidatus Saccharimonadales bacterium]